MEDGGRIRSFRYEDYNNRRVFLRSYPLQWGEEDYKEEDAVTVPNSKGGGGGGRRSVKERILAVLHLGGGKILLLRKLKNKVAFYLVSCHPFGFKSTTSLISV